MLTPLLFAAGLALFGAAQDANSVVATEPEIPSSSREELLRTALTDLLEERKELDFNVAERYKPEGTVFLLRDHLISPRVLPADSKLAVALRSREELEALAESGKRGYFLSMRLMSYSDETAVVSISLSPLVRKNEGALCCWTLDFRYDYREKGWKFVRTVGNMIH